MALTNQEIATQLLLALINQGRLFTSTHESDPVKKVVEAYDTMLTGVFKADENAYQSKKQPKDI